MLRLGQQVERYEVLDFLGRGGMAAVYSVRHNGLGSTHALKVLELTSPAILDRFLLEGRVQATLNHTNVVTVTDMVTLDGKPGLIMEYVAGPPLDAVLACGPLERSAALGLFRGIALGVAHAHSKGLVHRDLKPANVMLAQTPHGVVPKVADFGLAKVVHGEQRTGRATRTGAAMGTPAYMAPEQLDDASSVTHKADLYALGAMLYEFICGRPPWDAEGMMEVIHLRLDGDYSRPEVLVPGLEPHLVELIDALLEEDPDDRPESVREVLERLDGVSIPPGELPASEPVSGDFPRALAHISRPRPSQQDLDAFTQSDEPASVANTIPVPPPLPEPEPEPEPARSRMPWVALIALLLFSLFGAVGAGGAALWWIGSDWVVGAELPADDVASDPRRGVLPEPTSASDGDPEDPVPEPVPSGEPSPAPGPAPGAEPSPVPGPSPAPEPRPSPEVPQPGPAPTVAPSAPEPVPAPGPQPVAEPMPEPATKSSAPTLAIIGEADLVFLRRDGRDVQVTDQLSPGKYEVYAVFSGGAPVRAGDVTLVEGVAVTLSCTSAFKLCQRAR